MSKWKFFWWISIEGLVVPTVIILLPFAIFGAASRGDLDALSPVRLIIFTVVLAPFFETLLSQALPVMIARRLGFGFWGQVFASVVPFAALHISSGIGTTLGAGLVGGFYIAFTYVHWRQTSFRSALWMTSGTHAFHNLILAGVILIGKHS